MSLAGNFDLTQKSWSNLAKVVYKRTYARADSGKTENWDDTVNRVILGNTKNHKVDAKEIERLRYFILNRKAMPAGRGLWFSGSPSHEKLGGAALNNCWFTTSEDWENFVLAQDLLMLGGGVGLSVEHKYVSKLPKVKKEVFIAHGATKDADFIVPDSREGWNELTHRVLESFFVTGKSFTYSTICIRGYGEPIKGFGGKASGAAPLVAFIEKLYRILSFRSGKHIRPIDAADILCAIGELVVSGNVRRSAIIIIGDAWDKEYLLAKRWDLGTLPSYRAMANYSVVCEDVEDLHPLYWKTYEAGEAFGLINLKNIQTYARMGEKKYDNAQGVNPCVTGDTKILTEDGYKEIQSLVDQEVSIWNGFEWSTVVPKVTGTNQETLNISFNDGRILTCTPYHKFHISTDYRGGTAQVEAKDLKVGMKLIKHEFPIIEHGENYEKAYQQGFQSAEGSDGYRYIWVYEPKYACLDRLGGKKRKPKGGRTAVKFIHEFLPKDFVPFSWNIKSKLDWLAGLFDGDGTELKEGGLQLASVDRKFLKELQDLLSTLGVQSKISMGNPAGLRSLPDGHGGMRDYECKDCYRICIGAVQIQSLKRLGMKCERMAFDKSPQRDASQFIAVTEITKGEVEDRVYCFTENKKHLGIFNGILTGQCGEAALVANEPCNLQEQFLPNLDSPEEFAESSRLMHRWGKRVTCEKYHNPKNDSIVKKNRRVGTGITGCLQSPLYKADILDYAFEEIQKENILYSKELGIPESIRTTVVKPSGTLSLLGDCTPGIHPAYSKHFIRRVRFASNDNIIPILREANHNIEPVVKIDGTLDHGTLVSDFYCRTPDGTPCADEDFDTWKQLDSLLFAQKHWSDQAVSVTVYYKKDEIGKIKTWLSDNLKNLKTISFLCHNDHGFKQAPYEAITEEQYDKFSSSVKSVDLDEVGNGEIDSLECSGGVCPVK